MNLQGQSSKVSLKIPVSRVIITDYVQPTLSKIAQKKRKVLISSNAKEKNSMGK